MAAKKNTRCSFLGYQGFEYDFPENKQGYVEPSCTRNYYVQKDLEDVVRGMLMVSRGWKRKRLSKQNRSLFEF
jgi:hypothetical protein